MPVKSNPRLLVETLMKERDIRGEFEDAVNQNFDPTFSETEMDDFRFDFGQYSVWLRGSSSVEGTLPRRMQSKMDSIVKNLGIDNDIEYR